jgi:hypothetical protein
MRHILIRRLVMALGVLFVLAASVFSWLRNAV